MNTIFSLLFVLTLTACKDRNAVPEFLPDTTDEMSQPYASIEAIPVPAGYERVQLTDDSFGAWLRKIRLKKNKRVYLYNGRLKRNQSAQFAVVDMSIGNKDLQQCADVAMRLRAEYLFDRERYTEIEFRDNGRGVYTWTGGSNRNVFNSYLQEVFNSCGSI